MEKKEVNNIYLEKKMIYLIQIMKKIYYQEKKMINY